MNPAAQADFALLEHRVEVLEQREESTRRRLGEQEVELRDALAKQADALMSIRDDVHEIRAGKRAMVKLAGVAIAIVGATGVGVAASARWAITHWLQDLQTQHDPTYHRRIP